MEAPSSRRRRVGSLTPPSPLAEYRRLPDKEKTQYLTLRAYSGLGQLRKWEKEEIGRMSTRNPTFRSIVQSGFRVSPKREEVGQYYLVSTHGSYHKDRFVPDSILERFVGGVYFVTLTQAGMSVSSSDVILLERDVALLGAPMVRAMFEAYKNGPTTAEEIVEALRSKGFPSEVVDRVVSFHEMPKVDDVAVEVFDGLLNPPYNYNLFGFPSHSNIVLEPEEVARAESWGDWLRTLGRRPDGPTHTTIDEMNVDPSTFRGRVQALYGRHTFPLGAGGFRSGDSFTLPMTIYTVDGPGERLPTPGGQSRIAPIPLPPGTPSYQTTLAGFLWNIVQQSPGGVVREPVYFLIATCKTEVESKGDTPPARGAPGTALGRTVRGLRGPYPAERPLSRYVDR